MKRYIFLFAAILSSLAFTSCSNSIVGSWFSGSHGDNNVYFIFTKEGTYYRYGVFSSIKTVSKYGYTYSGKTIKILDDNKSELDYVDAVFYGNILIITDHGDGGNKIEFNCTKVDQPLTIAQLDSLANYWK